MEPKEVKGPTDLKLKFSAMPEWLLTSPKIVCSTLPLLITGRYSNLKRKHEG